MIPSTEYLMQEYINKEFSAKEISIKFGCSENKIHYWLKKYGIKKRNIKDATYIRANPNGDPFTIKEPTSNYDWFLYGLGIGLYWGEGNKANKHAVRLGNTDPALIKIFLLFLHKSYKIDSKRLHFGLQLFNDIDPHIAKAFWCTQLNVSPKQFYKTTTTKQNKKGTYRKKIPYGVLTVYFSNRKLRDIIVNAITQLQQNRLPM